MPVAPLYPVFLKLEGRKVLLVGGGTVAASKLDGLLAAGARVTVVAPEIDAALEREGVEWQQRPFAPRDLDGVWWAVAAATPEVNRQVQAAAEARQLFVNAVDDPAHATAYLGGVVRRGDVAIAISTGGRAPALAGLLREAFDDLVPTDIEDWARRAHELRQRQRAQGVPMGERRHQLLDTLNRLYDGRERVGAGAGGHS
jgi:uroporphyrin-III C-methyltransferase/precorrin-2 dehydrogenase/sirohydrochlorin ferrochelatase